AREPARTEFRPNSSVPVHGQDSPGGRVLPGSPGARRRERFHRSDAAVHSPPPPRPGGQEAVGRPRFTQLTAPPRRREFWLPLSLDPLPRAAYRVAQTNPLA